MKQLSLKHFGSGRSLLDYCYNALGYSELKLCFSYQTKESLTSFSRWFGYDLILALSEFQSVPPFRFFKKNLWGKQLHRSVLDVELLFDVDHPYVLTGLASTQEDLKKMPRFPNNKLKARWIMNSLRGAGFDPVCYTTGGKGYHIILIYPPLRAMDFNERRQFKMEVLQAYDCDVNKAGPRVLVSLEGCKHRITGKEKVEVEI